MEYEKLIINRFNSKNAIEYKETLTANCIPCEFGILLIQKLEHEKNIFLMFREYEKKFLIFKNWKREMIGYSIVEDVNALPKDYKGHWHLIYGVPDYVLEKNPIVISDFMISVKHRRKGYGSKLAEYVVNKIYFNKRIALDSVEDGVHFWHKFGFEYVEGSDSAMIIKGGKHDL